MADTATVRVTAEKLAAMAMVFDENNATNVESEMRDVREVAAFTTTFRHDNSADMRRFRAQF